MIPVGKGLYIWNLALCSGGDVVKMVAEAKNAGLSHVSIKVQDGIAPYNNMNQQARLEDVIPAFREAGISVWGWGYLYGNSKWHIVNQVEREAKQTNAMIDKWGLDGFHLDVEKEYKNAKAQQWAKKYLSIVYDDVSLGLSSYRFPAFHPKVPWQIFLDRCSHHYPQVYWQDSHNAGYQLRQSYHELIDLKDIPYVPVGSAYCWNDWCAKPSDIIEFLDTAKDLNCPGVSFWSWEHAQQRPDVWSAISNYYYDVDVPAPEPDPKKEIAAELSKIAVHTSSIDASLAVISKLVDDLG